jgi:hypothetical protein
MYLRFASGSALILNGKKFSKPKLHGWRKHSIFFAIRLFVNEDFSSIDIFGTSELLLVNWATVRALKFDRVA